MKAPRTRAKLSRGNRTAQAGLAQTAVDAVTFKPQSGPGMVPMSQVMPFDEHLLQRARTQWQYGDWHSLRDLDIAGLQHHPDRAKLALLAAAGHQQGGDIEASRHLVRLAADWGCSKRLISQVLVAGVHNVLARAASVCGDEARARKHFDASISTADPTTDVKLLGHARSVREMVSLGMLPQAAAYVGGALRDSREPQPSAARAKAHQRVLDIEFDWLRERVLQLQKQAYLSGVAPTMVNAVKQAGSSDHQDIDSDKKHPSDYHGLNALDRKLEAYVDLDDGYFVELGANDGVSQSNTLYFEKRRGWRGVLVEPILHNFLKCRQNRAADNHFYCAACVSVAYEQPYVKLTYANLMTAPHGVESDISDPGQHAQSGSVYLRSGETTVEVMAVARTLSSLLDEANSPRQMDLLSLDVEGGELEVLKGLDHDRHRFRYLLIECRDTQRVATYLANVGYVLIDKISHHDYLFMDKQNEVMQIIGSGPQR